MKPAALSLAVLLSLGAPAAQAHNVIAGVFPSGDSIEGEIGFSNGEMAHNVIVEVFDGAGNRIGQATTDDDGFFLFTPERATAHVFRANLGAGHVAEAVMSAEEVAEILGQPALIAAPATAPAPAPVAGQTIVQVAAFSPEEREAMADILRREMRPLRQEITALRTETQFQQILGGIGYIFGLFGLGFYLAARRKLQGKG